MSEGDKPKTVVVTSDAALLGAGKQLHEVDLAVLHPRGDGIVIESVEQFEEMARAAQRTYSRYLLDIAMKMTGDRAARIRKLRIGHGFSWRALADRSAKDWGTDARWSPPSNQFAGIALCQVAAETFGESAREPPWNEEPKP